MGLVFGTLKSELIQNPNVLNGISKPNHSKSEQNVHHFVQILNGLDNLSTICNPNAFQNTNPLKHLKSKVMDIRVLTVIQTVVGKLFNIVQNHFTQVMDDPLRLSIFSSYFLHQQIVLFQLVNHYLSQLDSTELHRRGFAQAIGNLPAAVLKGRLATVLPSLINRTKVGRVSAI